MRINDIIQESLEEAISVTQYESTVEEAVRLGISQAMAVMAGLRGRNPQEEQLMLDEKTKPLFDRFRGSLPDVLAEKISALIKSKLSNEIGKDVNLTVAFEPTDPNVKGLADNTEIILTDRYVKKLSGRILDKVEDSLIASYAVDEWVDATFFTFKMLGSQDRYLTGLILDNAIPLINAIVSTTLHELVHVLQHHRQFQKGRTDTEYRSYLDKKKGEFSALHNKDKDNMSDEEKVRYHNLYLASPQEMGSFSNEMALSFIRDADIRHATSEKEIASISSDEITTYVRKYIHNRYSDPKNQKEYAVFKRYAKLVYQEVQRYIEKIRKTFKKQN
jgi:hypothetical protein